MDILIWILVLFINLLFKTDVTIAGCPEPGWLNTFTYVPLKYINGYNIFDRYIPGDMATLQRKCEALCLAEPGCKSYEINFYYNDCYVSGHDMYDVPLSSSSDYDFYNRNYDCGCPPSQLCNVLSSHNGTTDGSVLTYTCDTGTRHPRLPLQLTCTSTGWGVTENNISCSVACGAPPIVSFAVVSSGNFFPAGQSVTYMCNPGYVINGTSTSSKSNVCQEDGTWEQPPTCAYICAEPPNVNNATRTNLDVYTVGDNVTYTCETGYVITNTTSNTATISCKPDLQWEQEPSCARNCGPQPSALHSSNSGVGTVFVPNEQVTYTCDSDYVMEGTQLKQAIISCQASGTWQNTPTCIVDCGAPPNVPHGSRTPTGTIFTPGDIVTWTCQNRYVVKENNLQQAQVICQHNGSWTTKPICIAYCGEHPAVDHSITNGTGSQDGHTRNYSCIAGHTMVGRSTITCLSSSEWETPPTCPADCGDASSLRNGNLFGSGNLENNTRNITCNDGYVLVGKDSIRCLPNGEWEPLPICQAAEVNAFQKHMFGASKSPISTQTAIAMIFAILFFICLLAACVAHAYMVAKRRKDKSMKDEKKKLALSENGGKSKEMLDSGHSNKLWETNTPDIDYDRPMPRGFQGDRSWRDMLI